MSAVRPPENISVFPEFAFAALRAGEETALAAWGLLRAWDSAAQQGSGFLDRTTAKHLISVGLCLGKRQTLRILGAGSGRYWDATERSVRLSSAVTVAQLLDVTGVNRPHEIPVESIRGASRRRATLIATAYRTDENGNPTTRRRVAELTGVAAQTQRRLDRTHREARCVTRVIAPFGRQVSQFYADSFAEFGHDWGFFSGSGRTLYRRHGDIRTAPTHQPGSSAAQRRLNHALKGERRPATSSRGQRPSRTYFQGDKAVPLWMRDKDARGKRASSASSIHPSLNYALVIGSPGPKRYRGTVLRETSVTGGVSRMSGGLVHWKR